MHADTALAATAKRGAKPPWAQMIPSSAKDTVCSPPTTMWSSTRTSTSASASFKRCVICRSAALGSGCPDGHDQSTRVVRQHLFDNFARMNRRTVDGSPEHLAVGDQLMLVIQHQDGEDFVFVASQLETKVVFDCCRRNEFLAPLHFDIDDLTRSFEDHLGRCRCVVTICVTNEERVFRVEIEHGRNSDLWADCSRTAWCGTGSSKASSIDPKSTTELESAHSLALFPQ